MGLVTLPVIWIAKQLVPAASLNADFNAILNQLNGNLDATNLANLAVTAAKLGNLAVTGPKIGMGSDAQGDILIRGATQYERLATGTVGQVLTAGGAGANPSWATPTPPGLTLLSSTPVVAQTTVPITGLLPGKKYKIILNLIPSAAEYFKITFNADGRANYSWSFGVGQSIQISYGGGSGAAYGFIGGGYSGPCLSEFTIVTAPGNNQQVSLAGIASVIGQLSYFYSAFYSGSLDLASMQIFVATGTVTGTIDVYEFL